MGFEPPFTLGHENAGWIAELGEGVTGFKEGDPVAVYGPWGCGRPLMPALNGELLRERASVGTFGGGLGSDGGMADYMLVPAVRLLSPAWRFSRRSCAAERCCADPYHASSARCRSSTLTHGRGNGCRRTRSHGDSTPRVLAPVRIIAADVDERKLEQAKALGADDVVNNRNAGRSRREDTENHRPRGAG